ncbi:origin recognition complex subunit 4 [Orobanche gracilis]
MTGQFPPSLTHDLPAIILLSPLINRFFYRVTFLTKEIEEEGEMGQENPAEEAKIILRNRLTNPSFIFSFFSQFTDSNYSKLKYIISSSVTDACNNSVLLLGPRGCGKNAVLELVLEELLKEHPDLITVRSISLVAFLDSVMITIFVFHQIKLNGLLHSDNNCAMKEISRQLCLEHQLMFSKMASFDDNSQFLLSMLRECGLAHKTIVFVLDEFDLFAEGKQRLLYSLLDALQSVTSQAVVVGVSCRLDADQLLEKRVRSRFSHRKLLFLPPSGNDLQRLVEHILLLPTDSGIPNDYAAAFNAKLLNILADEKFKEIVDTLSYSDSSAGHLLRFLFSVVCQMDLNSGLLSVENFKSALQSVQRQPKFEALKDCSILELYILVCMKRLEVKELELCNFNSVMKEYKSIHDNFKTSDYHGRNVCLRAFEHLLERGLIAFEDKRGHGQSTEFRPVKLLISWHQLHQGLKSNRLCPAVLHKLMDREV